MSDKRKVGGAAAQQPRKAAARRRKRSRSRGPPAAVAAAAADDVGGLAKRDNDNGDDDVDDANVVDVPTVWLVDDDDDDDYANVVDVPTVWLESTREPLPYSLRCQVDTNEQQQPVLWWHSTKKNPAIPFDVEQSLIDILVPYQKKERGMFRDQPKHRVRKVERICQAKQVELRTALSLRRHHMKRYNPGLGMSQLRLGLDNDVKESAELFELAVTDFLTRQSVEFYTEAEQKAYINKQRPPGQPFPLTPDFILKRPVRIKQYTSTSTSSGTGTEQERRVIQERTVHWIEVKMFYGASTIEQDGKSAVGCLQDKAQKYVSIHGPGAIVFMHGYGDRLAAMLHGIGVMTLDCSCRDSISLERVEAHQRTWCADREGNILP